MIDLHPKVIEKDGKKVFVVLHYEEFVRIQEELADYHDVQVLRAAKKEEGGASTMSLRETKANLGMARVRCYDRSAHKL